MIHIGGIGPDSPERIFKKFRKADGLFKTDGLIVKLSTDSAHVSGMFYIPPLMQSEIGNFYLSQELHSHPYWDYADIPKGPQITWFTIYSKFRGKGISASIYEGIIRHFGALYSDHQQTSGGTAIWKTLIKRKNVNVYSVQWRKKDWKIVSVAKQTSLDFESFFESKDIQTILLAAPIGKEIKEFKISNVEESIEVAYRK